MVPGSIPLILPVSLRLARSPPPAAHYLRIFLLCMSGVSTYVRCREGSKCFNRSSECEMEIRQATLEDLPGIARLLADDPIGGSRERFEYPKRHNRENYRRNREFPAGSRELDNPRTLDEVFCRDSR